MKSRNWGSREALKISIIRFLHTRPPSAKSDQVDVAHAMNIGQGDAREVLEELLTEGRIVVIV